MCRKCTSKFCAHLDSAVEHVQKTEVWCLLECWLTGFILRQGVGASTLVVYAARFFKFSAKPAGALLILVGCFSLISGEGITWYPVPNWLLFLNDVGSGFNCLRSCSFFSGLGGPLRSREDRKLPTLFKRKNVQDCQVHRAWIRGCGSSFACILIGLETVRWRTVIRSLLGPYVLREGIRGPLTSCLGSTDQSLAVSSRQSVITHKASPCVPSQGPNTAPCTKLFWLIKCTGGLLSFDTAPSTDLFWLTTCVWC